MCRKDSTERIIDIMFNGLDDLINICIDLGLKCKNDETAEAMQVVYERIDKMLDMIMSSLVNDDVLGAEDLSFKLEEIESEEEEYDELE
jgi:Na+/phosphate symporter